jgi:hypothetical protein
MITVVIESPYAGDVEENTKYLHECCQDCLQRGESPYASHGFFTHFLDDNNPYERALGIDAGLAWSARADLIVIYTDLGYSDGMKKAIIAHQKAGRDIEYRKIRP